MFVVNDISILVGSLLLCNEFLFNRLLVDLLFGITGAEVGVGEEG